MSDLPRHGHRHETPLRHWLAIHLPEDPPFRTNSQTWSLAQRYTAGEPVKRLSDDTGLATEAILQRLHYLARKLGYQSPTTTAWLLPDGRLADHAARRDDATGCLIWTAYVQAGTTGPYEHLPRSHWPPGHPGSTGPRTQIRQFLWERFNEPVPSNFYVAAICGDVACIALEHAALRSTRSGLSLEQIASMIERKGDESRIDAAARLGVSQETIARWRGPGGRRPIRSAPLRIWLRQHLPSDPPAGTAGLDWSSARRYAAGESLQAIATQNGLSRQAVQQRIRKLAVTLGYASEPGNISDTGPTHDHR